MAPVVAKDLPGGAAGAGVDAVAPSEAYVVW